jgi:hypothetical protein
LSFMSIALHHAGDRLAGRRGRGGTVIGRGQRHDQFGRGCGPELGRAPSEKPGGKGTAAGCTIAKAWRDTPGSHASP